MPWRKPRKFQPANERRSADIDGMLLAARGWITSAATIFMNRPENWRRSGIDVGGKMTSHEVKVELVCVGQRAST